MSDARSPAPKPATPPTPSADEKKSPPAAGNPSAFTFAGSPPAAAPPKLQIPSTPSAGARPSMSRSDSGSRDSKTPPPPSDTEFKELIVPLIRNLKTALGLAKDFNAITEALTQLGLTIQKHFPKALEGHEARIKLFSKYAESLRSELESQFRYDPQEFQRYAAFYEAFKEMTTKFADKAGLATSSILSPIIIGMDTYSLIVSNFNQEYEKAFNELGIFSIVIKSVSRETKLTTENVKKLSKDGRPVLIQQEEKVFIYGTVDGQNWELKEVPLPKENREWLYKIHLKLKKPTDAEIADMKTSDLLVYLEDSKLFYVIKPLKGKPKFNSVEAKELKESVFQNYQKVIAHLQKPQESKISLADLNKAKEKILEKMAVDLKAADKIKLQLKTNFSPTDEEVVYNIEIFRAGIREGDWKLVWRTPLPSNPELYNIAIDPYEKNNVAAANPDKVATLQKRANELAGQMEKSPLLKNEFQEMLKRIHLPPALPGNELEMNQDPTE